MNCYKHTNSIATKKCKQCSLPLCDVCIGNNLLCENCSKQEQKFKTKRSIMYLVFGIINIFLFLVITILTTIRLALVEFNVNLLVSSIILNVIILTVGIILIILGSCNLQN